MSKQAYSYHTFFFPFLWSDGGNMTFDRINTLLDCEKWRNNSVSGFEEASALKDDDYSLVANYQTAQYFTTSARQSYFGWDKDFVKCYAFNLPENPVYYIKKNIDKNRFNEWNLNLHGITLKIYNTGIGVLAFEAENHDYKTIRDVKAINEYGRRIFPPFIQDGGCAKCADELGIKCGDDCFECDLISTTVPQLEAECVPGFIRNLIPDEIKIKPAIDDRMFVACLVNDPEEFEKMMKYETDDSASENLYEFLYIDIEDRCSCPTRSMRSDLLSKSIYPRWIENRFDGKVFGNMYGVTHHSFMCITANTNPVYVEIPFLTIYTHIVSSVIAQRATILSFDGIVSELSCGFEKQGRNMSSRKMRKLQKLQEKYIAFLNQHMNIEITNQEQGIELYEMFQKELYIEKECEKLEKEINALSDAANTKNEGQLNRLAIFITIVILFAEPLVAKLIEWLPSLFTFFSK